MAKSQKTPIDEELINLLETVSKNKSKTTAPPEPVEPPPEPESDKEEPDALDEISDVFGAIAGVDEDDVIPEVPVKPPVEEPKLVPIQEVRDQKKLPESQLLAPDKSTDQLGIGVLLQKFGVSLDIILQNHKADRDQIETAIQFFEQRVRSGEARGIAPFVEAWAKLLATKAEINTNATSALDSVAKLLAAGKGNELVVNISGTPQDGDIDLETLLAQPSQEDEE